MAPKKAADEYGDSEDFELNEPSQEGEEDLPDEEAIEEDTDDEDLVCFPSWAGGALGRGVKGRGRQPKSLDLAVQQGRLPAPSCVAVKPPKIVSRVCPCVQDADDPEARAHRLEVARAEKERLRKQAEAKKEMLAKMKQEQDVGGSAAADVSEGFEQRALCLPRLVSAQGQTGQTASPPTPHSILQAARGQHRLNFLLRQAEIFQHFVPATKNEAKK